MKQNDWIIAGLTNPEFTTSEFLISGLNTDNTQLLTEDQYKKSAFVRDHFSENGVFNEDAFDVFYKQRASEFGKLQSMDVKDTFLYSPFDPRAKGKDDTQIRSPKFGFDVVPNTNREVTMLTGDVYSDEYSQRERAQQNRIFDTATGEWSEDTLNDRAFVNNPIQWFKTVFSDPLVYATYNEEGEHYDQFTGRMVKHQKGQYKINQYGLPYTETLNGRSLIGKEVVSAGDILTVDKEGIDEYNFFDSDDVKKSVTGTIMKAVASVAPMLMGPYVSGIYSGLLVGREVLKTLPMLYGLTTAWFNMPEENKTLNKLAGYAQSFTTSTSDYGRASMLNTEVIATLMSDVALQYGQQKFIANSISKLRGSKDLMKEAYGKAGTYYAMQRGQLEQQASRGVITKEALEKYVGDAKNWQESIIGKAAIQKFTKDVEPIVKNANRLGADASLAYMALVSNTDVYSSMLEAGASRKEAAIVALGSTVGMFTVDKYAHLGELFFDDLTADYEHQLRRTFTREAKSWYDNVIKQTVQDTQTSSFGKFRKLFQAGVDFGKKHISQFAEDLKYHSTGFFGKAIGEGIEEVSEELVADISKGIYEALGALGVDTQVKNVGAFKDGLKRYGMSFLGGTLGGGLFYGVNVYQNGKFHVDQTQDELIYLIRNNKTREALETLEDWRKKGKLGSTSLSTRITKGADGNDVFVTAENAQDSQNEFIYNRIKETILSLENIINENRAGLSEDDLFEKMIFSEARFRDLQKYLDLQKFSYTTGYQRDYQKAVSNIADLEAALKRANQTITGLAYSSDAEYSQNLATDEQLRNLSENEKKKRTANLKRIQDDLKEAKDELERFLSGEYSIDYTEKMLFALDKHLNEDFVAMTYEQWIRKNHDGKTPESLSPSEAEQYKEEYLNYKKSAQSQDLDQKFSIYKAIKERMNPILLKIQQGQEGFKKFQQEIDKLKSKDSPIFTVKQYKVDDVLDFLGETKDSDSYINRNNPELAQAREKTVEQENMRQVQVMRDEILRIIDESGGFIDPVARRDLKLLLNTRSKDVVEAIQQNLAIDVARDRTEINPDTGQIVKQGVLTNLDKSVLQLLETIDINNLDKASAVWEEIQSLVKKDFASGKAESNRALGRLLNYLTHTGFGSDLNPESTEILGSDLKAIIDQKVEEGLSLDEIFNINNTKLWSNDWEEYGVSTSELTAFLANIRRNYQAGTLDDYEWTTINIEKATAQDTGLQQDIQYYNQIYQEYLDKIKSNPIIELNKELDARVSNINPIIELVKSLGLNLNTDMNNLEKILQNLDSRFEEIDDIRDLTVSSEEKESLEEAAYIIKLAKSYLYAASAVPTILSPFGHNAVLNEFAEHHKDVYKDYQPLPVLSTDVAAMYEHELNRYLLQMGTKDEQSGQYNAGSWLWLSSQNEINKAQQFIRADRAWCKTSYDFFAQNANSFKFSYDGKEYDLLEGFETVPQVQANTKEALVHLNKLFNLFYNNVQKLIKQGWTYKQIWERSKILERITILKNVPQQKTCSLDENITLDRMTDYDKVIFLATIASMDSTKFYSYLLSRVNEEDGIVPLTIQEWVSRVGIAQIENPEIFNQTLEYVQQETKDPRPIIPNATYIGGNAGAGKSRVAGRNIAKYIKGNNIWLSAPKESQINTLFDSTTKGIKFLNRETLRNGPEETPSLMTSIGVDEKAYKEAMRLLNSESTFSDISKGILPNTPYFTVKETKDAMVIVIDPTKFGIKAIENAPDAIIIDEATHLSNLEIQLLGYFAKLNGTKLIFLGDNKQRGYTGLGRNIDREQCMIVRTPNLGISLRDNNIQHQFNLNTVEALINQLSDLDLDDDNAYKIGVNAVRSLIKSIKFKVYNQDDIHGEMFLKSLTPQFIGKMKGDVGYVGRKGATLEALQNSGLNVTVLPETDIQGQEFDYVVIDKDFELPNSKSSGTEILEFLQDLYTMISRGRKGSIIIDPNNALQNIIGTNKVEFAKAEAISILEYAGDFRKEKIDLLNKVLSGTQPSKTEPTDDKVKDKTSDDSGNSSDPAKIILDKDFSVEDLDFDNNYYVIYQTGFTNAQAILENGLKTETGLTGSALFANRDIILQVINLQKEGRGYEGSDSIILMEFSKKEFEKEKIQLDDISEKLYEKGFPINVVPPQYIKNIIHTIPETTSDDVRTDGTEIVEEPVITDGELDEIEISEDELPVNQEDIPNNPMLCHGAATFTGMQVEVRNGKQVWINPVQDYTGTVLGESKVKSGAVPVIKSYSRDADGFIKITLGSQKVGSNRISSKSQVTVSRDSIVPNNDGQFVLDHTDDQEFTIQDIVIRPDGTISVTLVAVKLKGTNDNGTDISGVSDMTVQIKSLPAGIPLGVRRDGQIFTGESEIADDQNQIDISNKIRAFKNAFLYRKSYDQLPKYITNIISREAFEGMKWFIEARPRTAEDNFIRNTPFKEDKMEISTKGLVFSVVGEFKLNNGETGRITLGLMGDPANWINKIPDIKKRLDRKIAKLKSKIEGKKALTKAQRIAINAKIAKYEEYKKRLDLNDKMSDPRRYEAYIEDIASRFDGTNPVIVEIPSIITPGLTDLHKQPQAIRVSRMSNALIRNAKDRIAKLQAAMEKARGDSALKSKILWEIKKAQEKLKEFETIRDQSFRSLNPYTTVSPMYIYTPAVRGNSDIDDSVVGKCNVVFVTNEEGVDPNELVNIYLAQKNKTEQERAKNGVIDLKESSVVPSVRMVVLNNLGVSFQDMSNPYLAESMKTEVSFTTSKGKVMNHAQIYPFKTNFMGIRMYVGLWNFRANLLQFQKQLTKFTKSLPIDVKKLDEYLITKDLKWRKENGRKLTPEEEDFFSKHQVLENFDEFSRLVDEFNDSLGDKVKQFRLGSDLTNGAYIRYLTGNTAPFYSSKDRVSGIYINSSTLEKYINIANSLFENVLDYIVTCDYDADRLLSTKQGKKNSFANHLTSLANSDGQIEVIDAYSGEKDTINFGSSYDPSKSKGILNTFSHIPAVLSKVFKFTSIRQKHLIGNNFDTKEEYSIRIKGTIQQDGKDVEIDKSIPYWRLWKHVDMIEASNEYDIAAIEGHTFDPTLSNFFSFAFHGTLENVNDRNPQRAADALFPYGFFADPLSTTEYVQSGGSKMFTKAVQQQLFFGSDVRVNDPTFFISLQTLQQAVDDSKKPIIEENNQIMEESQNIINAAIAKYPQLTEEFQSILQDVQSLPDETKLSYTTSAISEALQRVTKNNFDSIFSGILKNIDSNALVSMITDTEAISLSDMISMAYSQSYNEELPGITNISVDGKSLIVDAGDVTVKVTRGMNNTITVTKQAAPVVEDSVVIQKVNDLLQIIQTSLKPDQIQEITTALDTYSKVNGDLKQQQKKVIIDKITRIGRSLITKQAIFKQIRQTISEITPPNCV